MVMLCDMGQRGNRKQKNLTPGSHPRSGWRIQRCGHQRRWAGQEEEALCQDERGETDQEEEEEALGQGSLFGVGVGGLSLLVVVLR